MNNEFKTPQNNFNIDSSFTGDVPLKDPSVEAEKRAKKSRMMLGIFGVIIALLLSIVFSVSLYYTSQSSAEALNFLGENVGMVQIVLLGLATFFGLVFLFGMIACLVNHHTCTY